MYRFVLEGVPEGTNRIAARMPAFSGHPPEIEADRDVVEDQADQDHGGRNVERCPEAEDPIKRVLSVELELLPENRLEVCQTRALGLDQERGHPNKGGQTPL